MTTKTESKYWRFLITAYEDGEQFFLGEYAPTRQEAFIKIQAMRPDDAIEAVKS